MKALILAGGRGSRLNELTLNKNKSMLMLLGKPIIEYNLEHALSAGVSEIILVVGYRAEEIINHLGEEYRGTKIKYVFQEKQRGLVNAMECAKKEIRDSDFILMLADEILLDAKIKMMKERFDREEMFAVCGVTYENDKSSIGKTYSVMTNEKGRLFRLIEKPRHPINNIKGTGHCIFRNEILEYIDRTPINANRGEKELVDLIQVAVDEGKKVEIFPITRGYVNVNSKEDLDLAKEMIEKNSPRILIVHPQMKFFGGAELLIVELSNWLTKRGIKNDILTATKSNEVESKLVSTKIIVPKNNLDISATGFGSAGDIMRYIKIFRKAIKKIRKNYDVINFHNFPATWTLYPNKMASVWMLNEPPNLWSRPGAGITLRIMNNLRKYADKKIVRRIKVICVGDEFNKKRCKERYVRESRVVYYGVNYDFFSKGTGSEAIKKYNLKNKFIVVQSGVITENKNQLESIKAIENVREKIPNILLVLAGKVDENYKKIIESYVKEKKLEKNVIMIGNIKREELRDLYKASDVGLYPVGKQGGWLAPFEHLCSEVPIIVSESMGAASIIKKNNLGIVSSSYEDSLIEVWNNKNKYNNMAKNAAIFVKKNLSWEIFSDKMIKAYKDAISVRH